MAVAEVVAGLHGRVAGVVVGLEMAGSARVVIGLKVGGACLVVATMVEVSGVGMWWQTWVMAVVAGLKVGVVGLEMGVVVAG